MGLTGWDSRGNDVFLVWDSQGGTHRVTMCSWCGTQCGAHRVTMCSWCGTHRVGLTGWGSQGNDVFLVWDSQGGTHMVTMCSWCGTHRVGLTG